MTVKEAAEALGISIYAVQRRLQRGIMRGEKPGHDWVIPTAEVEAWRGRGRLRPGPKPKDRPPKRPPGRPKKAHAE